MTIARMCRACNTGYAMQGSEYCVLHLNHIVTSAIDALATVKAARQALAAVDMAERSGYNKTRLLEQIETSREEWLESLREDGSSDAKATWDYEYGIVQGLQLAKAIIEDS